MAKKDKIKKLDLPGIYSNYIWKMGGSIPEYKKYIGYPYLSNSQGSTFNSKSGFNTWKPGHLEWIQTKILGYRFPDVGWAQFGKEVEAVITEEEGYEEVLDNFTDKEIEILKSIKPLGVQQRQIVVDFTKHGFIMFGYVDDNTPPETDENGEEIKDEDGFKFIKVMRDYKTASLSSSKKLGNKDDYQLDLYVKAYNQLGYKVGRQEYFIIDRGGGGPLFKNNSLGRAVLTVEGIIGIKDYTLKDWDKVEKHFVKTAKEMEKYHKAYKKLIN